MDRKKSEKLWRERLKSRLVANRLWSRFNRQRVEYQTTRKCYRQTAWRKVSEMDEWKEIYPWKAHHKTMTSMCSHLNKPPKAVVKSIVLPDNKKDLDKIFKVEKLNVKKRDREEFKKKMATKKQLADQIKLDKASLEEERELVLRTVPCVKIRESGKFDPRRDAIWVYENMSRLFIMDDRKIERLDERVLKEAPSNGAIGLAHNALQDKEAFYSKWMFKILPKDDENGEEDSDDEAAMMSEHDPSFDGLEKYFSELK